MFSIFLDYHCDLEFTFGIRAKFRRGGDVLLRCSREFSVESCHCVEAGVGQSLEEIAHSERLLDVRTPHEREAGSREGAKAENHELVVNPVNLVCGIRVGARKICAGPHEESLENCQKSLCRGWSVEEKIATWAQQ
eukprot:Gb_25371 [translate_table: standard]